MSMKLMVRVLEECELTRPQQAVLLSMAENANDDGSNCRPSVDLIAWKAGYKPRNVVDIMRELRHMGVLEVVREATQRRATEYRIHLNKAPRKQSFEDWQSANGRHAGSVRRGAISRVAKNDEGCNLTSSEVQSHVLEVQSHVETARENAPEPVTEPVNRTSQGTSHSDAPKARPKAKAKPSPKSFIPDDFHISDRLLRWADEKGFTVEEMESQFERFQNNARMKQHRYADWDAAFQNWMHNARDWGHLDRKPAGGLRIVNAPGQPRMVDHRGNFTPEYWAARAREEEERERRAAGGM